MKKKELMKPLKVKSKVGAPTKPDDQKKNSNTGLTGAQDEWIIKEAEGRGVPKTDILREAVSMYISAMESQRADMKEVEALPVVNESKK